MSIKEQVYSQIEQSGNIPVLPEILHKLLVACDDEDTSISEIGEIISRDPALSLRVLQLVNSAYYAFQHTFQGIEPAVVYLGADTIKNLAVTTSVHHVFENKLPGKREPFDMPGFWYHSLMCATIARRVALLTGYGNGEEAYLAGLLHDMGKLLLNGAFADEYTPASPGYGSGEGDINREHEQVGVNHADAGSWLVRKWSLGALIADAIQYHHEPLEQVEEGFPLVKIIYTANVLSLGEEEFDRGAEACNRLFGLQSESVQELVEGAADEVDQISSSMGLKVKVPSKKSAGENAPATVESDSGAESALMSRVRNVSLLSNFQETLMQADEPDGIFIAFEEAVHILFGLDRVLFFIPAMDGVLLRGQCSSSNMLYRMSEGLTFSANQTTSCMVQAYQEDRRTGYISKNEAGSSIADQQLLSVLDSSTAYFLQMRAEKKIMGVLVIGLSDQQDSLSDDDSRFVRVLAKQAALKLYLHQEKERRDEQLKQERMDAISLTARKFAHEINNPLGIIGNYLMTMKLKLAEEAGVHGDLEIIDEEIKRISSMVSQMEMFSQAPFSELSQIDLNRVIRDIVQLIGPSLYEKEGMSVSFIPANDLPLVSTSKDGIKQVLINLLKNAAEAMAEGGRAVVRTRIKKGADAVDIVGVEIIVADSGPGLPEIVKSNLFKPFVTTKQNGHSGLGLSIVQKTVTELGGTLSCSSKEGEGTSFTIVLPVTKSG